MLPTHITKRTTTRREEDDNEEVAVDETPTRPAPPRTRNKCDSAKIMTCIRYFLVFCLGLAINPHDILTYFIDDPTTITIYTDPHPHPPRTDPVIPKDTQIVVVPTSPPTKANTCELITKPYPILKPVPGVCADPPGQTQYITAKQNPGGGFGHQTSNVLYGMLFAQACNFTFIFHDYHGHCEGWNAYSGFGSGCINYAKDVLAPNSPYQVIELPTPKLSQQDSSAPIPSCSALQLPPYKLENGKTKLVWKIDDAATYHQCAPIPTLRQWFWSGRIHQHPDKNEVWSCYILAAHIRRGDTKGMKGRYLSLQVYQDILPKAHAIMSQSGYTRIHIFSDGKPDEIQPLIDVLPDAKLMRGTVYQDWEGMVRADVFMHAKSSFSHQAGLLGDNIKLSPSFWHYTQCDERWIHVKVDDVGEDKQAASFDEAKFKEQWEKYVKYRKETERPVYG